MPADWNATHADGSKVNAAFMDTVEWPPFFHMPVLMLMLITLLNDFSLITIGYDNATARDDPEKWNIPVLFLVSCTLVIVTCNNKIHPRRIRQSEFIPVFRAQFAVVVTQLMSDLGSKGIDSSARCRTRGVADKTTTSMG
jgi:hypothetical protein